MQYDGMPVPTESVEQQRLFQWAFYETGAYPELDLMYHIPNEGKRSRATGGRMRAEGLKSGVPDICLPIPRAAYKSLYIELKRRKGGTLSDAQHAWLLKLQKQGHCVCWCQGWEAAAAVIKEYLRHGTIRYRPTSHRGGDLHA